MKAIFVFTCVVTLSVAFGLQAQNLFQNLAFESATIPPGQPNPDVFAGRFDVSVALPGWNAYVGTRPERQILHDNFFLDSAGIGVVDSFCTPILINCNLIQGNFTAFLEPGHDLNSPGTITDVSIAQTGLIPVGMRSLRFLAGAPGRPDPVAQLRVLVNGQEEPLYLLGTTPDFNGYGIDVSALAGQTAEVRFTAGFGSVVFLDAVAFSPVPVPEPGVGWLFAVGIGVVLWRRRTGWKSGLQPAEGWKKERAQLCSRVNLPKSFPNTRTSCPRSFSQLWNHASRHRPQSMLDLAPELRLLSPS